MMTKAAANARTLAVATFGHVIAIAAHALDPLHVFPAGAPGGASRYSVRLGNGPRCH